MKKGYKVFLSTTVVVLISCILLMLFNYLFSDFAYGDICLIPILAVIYLIYFRLIKKGTGMILVDLVYCLFIAGIIVIIIPNIYDFLLSNGNGYSTITH